MPDPKEINLEKAILSGNFSFFYDESTTYVNVHPCEVTFEGITYKSAEHAYQANKFCIDGRPVRGSESVFNAIVNADSPIYAKDIAHAYIHKAKSNWEEVKFETMIRIICAKMRQHPEIAQELIDTYPKYLVEKVPSDSSRDRFWGMNNQKGNLNGRNAIGRALMTVRLMLIRKQLNEKRLKDTVYFVEQ